MTAHRAAARRLGGAPMSGRDATMDGLAVVPPERTDALAAARGSALHMFGADAYEQEVIEGRAAGRPWFLLNAPEAIQHVLVNAPENYRRTAASIRILRPITGRGLLLTEGEEWRWQRRTTAPALAPRSLRLLVPHMARAAQAAREALAAEADAGPVDLLAAMQALALDIAARSMFSLASGGFGPQLRAELGRFGPRLAQPTMLDMLLPIEVPAPRDLARWWFRRRFVRLMDAVVAERATTPPPEAPRDLFDLLVAARDPETGGRFTPVQLRDQITTLIVAGHETTALALFWSLYLLAITPDAQARVAEEATGVDLGPEQAGAALPRLAYAAAVVNEALRLFPPAFTLVRQARVDDVAGAIAIPRRSVVMIAPWVLHRHKRLWEAPDAFRPERFLPDAPTPPRYAYLPFGAGPRVCVGAQFALMEATLALAVLVRAFRVVLADSRPVLPAPVITTQPDHAPPFRLTRR